MGPRMNEASGRVWSYQATRSHRRLLVHRNAPLTPEGRLRLCQRIEGGWPVAHAAESMGISRDRAYVWWRRYQAEGIAGLEDRSSRPASFTGTNETIARASDRGFALQP